MKSSTKWLIGIVLIFVIGFIYFGANNEPEIGLYDDLARCIANSGAKMYGAYWCPHCLEQKELFGSSEIYLPYVECDPRGNNANPQACEEAGIEEYPTWIFANGEKITGKRELSDLSVRTSCTPP